MRRADDYFLLGHGLEVVLVTIKPKAIPVKARKVWELAQSAKDCLGNITASQYQPLNRELLPPEAEEVMRWLLKARVYMASLEIRLKDSQ